MTRLMLFGDALIDIDNIAWAGLIGDEECCTEILWKEIADVQETITQLDVGTKAKAEFDAWAKSLNKPFIIKEQADEHA